MGPVTATRTAYNSMKEDLCHCLYWQALLIQIILERACLLLRKEGLPPGCLSKQAFLDTRQQLTRASSPTPDIQTNRTTPANQHQHPGVDGIYAFLCLPDLAFCLPNMPVFLPHMQQVHTFTCVSDTGMIDTQFFGREEGSLISPFH